MAQRARTGLGPRHWRRSSASATAPCWAPHAWCDGRSAAERGLDADRVRGAAARAALDLKRNVGLLAPRCTCSMPPPALDTERARTAAA